MATEFNLKLLTPSKSRDEVKSTSVVIPGSQGYMTILPDHAALISELGIGEMVVTHSGNSKTDKYFLSGGFLEVIGDNVFVMAEHIEQDSEIDVSTAKKTLEEVTSQLSKGSKSPEELTKLSGQLKEAEYRIKIGS